MLGLNYCVSTNFDWQNQVLEIHEMREWIRENIGDAYDRWVTETTGKKIRVRFKYEKDALLFALRWA
jgi:hypothetical protein